MSSTPHRHTLTYRFERRNAQRANGGLSRKQKITTPAGPQTAKHYKQTREAARRLRQMAARKAEVA